MFCIIMYNIGKCRFAHRCPYARQACAEQEAALAEISPAHFVACPFCGETK